MSWHHLYEDLNWGPAFGSQQPRAPLQVWGKMPRKLLDGKGLGSAGQQPAQHEPALAQVVQESSDILACVRSIMDSTMAVNV